MKYGITQWSYPGNGIYAMKYVADAGYDGMQIELGGLDNGYYMGEKKIQEAYREEAAKYGLEFPSIVLNDLMYHGLMGNKDGIDFKSCMHAQELILETADAMRLDYVMLPFFFESEIKTDEDFERAVVYITEICAKAKPYGIKIGAETALNWDKQIALMDAVEADNLDCFFDTQNYMWYDGYSQIENMEKLYSRLGNQLHLCDGSGTRAEGGTNGGMLLGAGKGEFLAQMDILRKNKFDGWMILENIYTRPAFYAMKEDPYVLAENELRYVIGIVSEW
ncbi:MAG: sugar phosphate isomerase/epimerase [Christensenella sp.]|nr:sugar phosphate isomerase/epimerase [Christensenella sp.]